MGRNAKKHLPQIVHPLCAGIDIGSREREGAARHFSTAMRDPEEEWFKHPLWFELRKLADSEKRARPRRIRPRGLDQDFSSYD